MKQTIDLKAFLKEVSAYLEPFLSQILPKTNVEHHVLFKAMRYSTLSPGKRLRPALVFAAGYAFDTKPENLLAPAAAVEVVHCYSLIHDDLPAMDDDDLRRGQKTCHKAFDEATAILAGDALQTLAFELLSDREANLIDPSQQIRMIQILSHAIGASGMVLGQAEDMAGEQRALTLDELISLHSHKTGALIEASILLGAIASGVKDEILISKLKNIGYKIGLAFQIQDDVLDITASSEVLGKPQASDLKHDKMTFPKLLGLEGAREKAATLYQEAMELLGEIPHNMNYLAAIARYFIERQY